MIEFAPRKRRLADVRLTDYPNTLTAASVIRALEERVARGLDPLTELQHLTAGIENWRRNDKPSAAVGDVVTVELGSTPYAYRATYPCVVGDKVRVPGIAGETIGTVVALASTYTGPVKSIYGRVV